MKTTISSFRLSAPEKAFEPVEQRLHSPEDAHLLRVFKQCYLNTLDTTVELLPDGTSFIVTGDIPAMWLRDSSAQVRPYLRLARSDSQVQSLIAGLIKRQAEFIIRDPYANAFNREPNSAGHQDDLTAMQPIVWERKYEVDSLCYPLQLSKDYHDTTGDTQIFDETLHQALRCIVETFEVEQQHDSRSPYRFERRSDNPLDTLPFGCGTRTNFTGMTWSGFRPSDDACTFGYLIPANMFAVVTLGHLARFAREQYADLVLAEAAEKLRNAIDFGIQTYGIVDHPRYGRIYAYETDGYGNYNLMDDANVPSLLSIPYLGYRPAHDPVYQNTRAFILSTDNPYYFRGRHAAGIGSPHTPPGYIWPISLIMQALTSTDRAEQRRLLDTLVDTSGGTDYMHESFDPNHPETYTRAWFGWANSLFGELVYRYVTP